MFSYKVQQFNCIKSTTFLTVLFRLSHFLLFAAIKQKVVEHLNEQLNKHFWWCVGPHLLYVSSLLFGWLSFSLYFVWTVCSNKQILEWLRKIIFPPSVFPQNKLLLKQTSGLNHFLDVFWFGVLFRDLYQKMFEHVIKVYYCRCLFHDLTSCIINVINVMIDILIYLKLYQWSFN